MAFGSKRGDFYPATAAVTNPFAGTGSIAVTAGDLGIAAFVERGNLTVGTGTDNLGNTWTPVSNGVDAGTATLRIYYCRFPSSGTLTSVSFTTTASNDDAAIAIPIFEGPFAESPLDKNPDPIQNDVASPLVFPPTGVLSQADELIVGVLSSANGVADSNITKTPMLFASDAGGTGANSVHAYIGYQVVSSTDSVTPSWTTSAIGGSTVLATLSFKGDSGQKTLTANALTNSSPDLGTATFDIPNKTLAATELANTSPVLGAPAFTSIHALTANELINSLPDFGAPALLAIVPLTASGLVVEQENTVLLLHFDGSDGSTNFVDATGRHTVTPTGSAQIDTAWSQFGGSSIYIPDSSYISTEVSADDYTFGTGDFTIDFRCVLDDLSVAWTYHNLVYFWGGGNIICIALQSNGSAAGKLAFIYGGEGELISTPYIYVADTPYHITLARHGTETKMFVDGQQVGSTYTDNHNYGSNSYLRLGADFNGGGTLNGWLDEVRILKGRAAWTENFTPPIAPYALSLPAVILQQAHTLTAAALENTAPVLDAPAFSVGAATLVASEFIAGAPVLDAPALVANASLSANELVNTSPVLDAPAFAQICNLIASELINQAPELGVPTTGVISHLVANELANTAPVLDAVPFAQSHAIIASDLINTAPLLPVLNIGGDITFIAADLINTAPTFPVLYLGGMPTDLNLGDYTLDSGLNAFAACDRIYLCSQDPDGSFANAVAYALGEKTLGAGNVFGSISDGSPTGRKITSVPITDGDVYDDGTVSHWAAVDYTNSRFMASSALAGSGVVYAGQKFRLPAITVHLPSELQ